MEGIFFCLKTFYIFFLCAEFVKNGLIIRRLAWLWPAKTGKLFSLKTKPNRSSSHRHCLARVWHCAGILPNALEVVMPYRSLLQRRRSFVLGPISPFSRSQTPLCPINFGTFLHVIHHCAPVWSSALC